jgi:hypothetical protein
VLPHGCSHQSSFRGNPAIDWEAESASNRIKSLAAASYDWCAGEADLTLFIIQVVEHRKVATTGMRTDWARAGNLAGVSQVNCAVQRLRVPGKCSLVPAGLYVGSRSRGSANQGNVSNADRMVATRTAVGYAFFCPTLSPGDPKLGSPSPSRAGEQ